MHSKVMLEISKIVQGVILGAEVRPSGILQIRAASASQTMEMRMQAPFPGMLADALSHQ